MALRQPGRRGDQRNWTLPLACARKWAIDRSDPSPAGLPTRPKTAAEARALRLAAALKANIARRKAQAGARAGDDCNDNTNEG